jgi:hypothetical protein
VDSIKAALREWRRGEPLARTHLLAFALLVGLSAPALVAAADQSHCIDTVCAGTSSGEAGEGACGAYAPYYEQWRRVLVTWQDGSTYHQAYVENFCYAYGWGDYGEHGSGLGAGYYSFGDQGFQTIRAGWFGFTWTNGEQGSTDCRLYLYSYGMAPRELLDLNEGLACPDDRTPGMLLPALP